MIDFEIVDEDNFYIHLDKELLMEQGRKMITDFLVILQIYKSSGAVDRATKFYDYYS